MVHDFPEEIKPYLKEKECVLITEAQTSGDLVYRIGDEYILKVSENIQRLERECSVNNYLKGRLPVSETVAFTIEGEKAYYLKTCVKGNPLIGDYLKDPVKLAKLLAQAMRMFHSVDISDCDIINSESQGSTFVHGDFCLPNILAEDGEITGFIDTEAAGIGDPWLDIAWCIWSYEYNLGTKEYTNILLDELGVEFDKEKYELYTAL